jgi:hypothetical protein
MSKTESKRKIANLEKFFVDFSPFWIFVDFFRDFFLDFHRLSQRTHPSCTADIGSSACSTCTDTRSRRCGGNILGNFCLCKRNNRSHTLKLLAASILTHAPLRDSQNFPRALLRVLADSFPIVREFPSQTIKKNRFYDSSERNFLYGIMSICFEYGGFVGCAG